MVKWLNTGRAQREVNLVKNLCLWGEVIGPEWQHKGGTGLITEDLSSKTI